MLTTREIRLIRDIIDKYMNVVMYMTTGDGKLSPEVMKKLGIPKEIQDLVGTAFQAGKLEMLQGMDLSQMSDSDLYDFLRAQTLTAAQKKAVEYARTNAGLRISNLSSKVSTDIIGKLIQADKQQLTLIQEVVSQGLLQNKTRGQVAMELRETCNNWTRDWDRVAITEMWDAKLNGEAMAILSGESKFSNKGGETMVFKRPAHNACNQCKRLYLEADGVTPKLFTLTELMANGTNQNRKTAEWLPTLGVLHPNCLCTLSIFPGENWEFDENGQLVLKED